VHSRRQDFEISTDTISGESHSFAFVTTFEPIGTMWIAVLRLDLLIPGSRSLKDRRQAVRSLKERLRNRFDVACSEVGDLESWNRASLGIAAVANEKSVLQELADEISRYAQNDPNVQVTGVERDYCNYGEA